MAGSFVTLAPLTEDMRAFTANIASASDIFGAFGGSGAIDMSVGIRLYAQAYPRSPDHTRLEVIARQKLIRKMCLRCNDSATCSTDPVYAVAMCRACVSEDKRCMQPARSDGYCVFHDPQLLSM